MTYLYLIYTPVIAFVHPQPVVTKHVVDVPNESIRLSSREQAQYIKYLTRVS